MSFPPFHLKIKLKKKKSLKNNKKTLGAGRKTIPKESYYSFVLILLKLLLRY